MFRCQRAGTLAVLNSTRSERPGVGSVDDAGAGEVRRCGSRRCFVRCTVPLTELNGLFLDQMSAEAYTDCAVINFQPGGALRTAITGLSPPEPVSVEGTRGQVRAE